MLDHSNKLLQWRRLKSFNTPVWTVLIGSLLARTSYFMAWPYLITILYRNHGASEVTVGAMLAGSAFVGATSGLYTGYLSDKLGRRPVMVIGGLVAAFAYAGIGLAQEIWQFGLFLMFTGLMRPMIETPAKAVIGDHLPDNKDRELGLNIRYFLINLGGAIGPVIGITLALSNPQLLFLICALVYLGFSVFLFFGIQDIKKSASQTLLPNFRETVSILKKDRIFLYLLAANFIMMFVYAQYESSVPQIIVRSSIDDAAALIALLVLTNTLTIVLFQFPMLHLLERFALNVRTRLGMTLMGVSQLIFLSNIDGAAWLWIFATFVLSMGEVIAFPTLNVQIDEIAPKHLRGSYFGAATLSSLGFSAAPLIGGAILHYFNADWLFLFCFALSLVMIGLYYRVQKIVTLKNNALSC
ncbi:MDR family MFS transporter [Reinekea thalattae]|nr:MFS transporter [Reinekea thalattae]